MTFKIEGEITTGPYAGKLYIERFCEQIQYGRPNDCWEWQGKMFRNGYGCFYYKGRYLLSHRVSYEIAKDLITSPVVRHTCHNRACVNPNHLIEGTQSENIQDSLDAGRLRTKVVVRGDGTRYSSLQEAASENGDASNISKAALGKKKTAYGFTWRYDDV